jgi:hypothetical protein
MNKLSSAMILIAVFPRYAENLDMGASWNLQNIKSEKSGLSHSFFNTLHATIFGKRFKVVKVNSVVLCVTDFIGLRADRDLRLAARSRPNTCQLHLICELATASKSCLEI